jgi:hypothetical protein
MQPKRGDASDAGEILIQAEETCLVLNSDGSDQGIDGFQANAFRASQPGNRGCLTVGGKATRLEQLPQGKLALDAIDVPRQSLQDLGHDHPGERERLGFMNHSP